MRGGDLERTLRYDAENRLRVIEDTHNGTMSLYTYNHTGERSLKRYGAFNTAYLNGAYAGSGLDGLTRYSAYVSPDHLGSTTHITDKGGKVVQYVAKKILPEKVGNMLELKANLWSVELFDASISYDTELNKMYIGCDYVGEDGRCKMSQCIDVCGFAAESEWNSRSDGYFVKGTHKSNLYIPLSETTIDNESTNTDINVTIGEITRIIGIEGSFKVTDSNKNFDSNEK